MGARGMAKKLRPQNRRAVAGLARLPLTRGDRDRALASAREARKLAPDDVEVTMLMGRLTLETNDFLTAFNLLREASLRRPDDGALHYDLGFAALAVGRVDESTTIWKRALQLESISASAPKTRENLILLDAIRDKGAQPAVIALAQSRLAADPKDLVALAALGTASMLSTDRAKSLELWEKALSLYPEFYPARRGLVKLLASDPTADSRTAELVVPARDLLVKEPDLVSPLGIVFSRLGDHRRAITLLEIAVRQSPKDSQAWFHLGVSQQATKQTKAAQISLQNAIQAGLTGEAVERANQIIQSSRN